MMEKIKSLVPQPLLRRLRASLVLRNRKQILQTCNLSDRVFIQPVNRVEHYFHFIFDLSLPLWGLIRDAPSEVTFVVKRFGVFTERLQELFPDRIEIVEDESVVLDLPKKSMLGMNPQFVHLEYIDIVSFKNQACRALNIDQDTKQDKVILIERMPPDAYFSHQAVKKGAGTSRRSIPNHKELQQAIQSIVKVPFEFLNVQLENTSFEEQIRLFDRSLLVIAQHGAGLANCVWMRHQSHVFELSHDLSLRHFCAISKHMEHRHTVQKTTGNHASVNVASVVGSLLSNECLTEVLERNDSS